jgi:hypothetical protein
VRRIHSDFLAHTDVLEFAELAGKYCDVIDSMGKLPKAEFLRQLEELIPLVYSRGHRLSDPYNWSDDEDDSTDAASFVA